MHIGHVIIHRSKRNLVRSLVATTGRDWILPIATSSKIGQRPLEENVLQEPRAANGGP